MKPILCAALLAMILYSAESGPFGQDPGYGDRGDYGGPPAGRRGNGDQKASQGGILDKLNGFGQNLGLPKQSLQGGQQDKRQGLGQMFGSRSEGGNSKCPLSGLLQNAGSALGLGGGLNGLLQGLGGMFSEKGQKSGSSGGRGGRRKKSGSCNQGAESGRNGYGSDYGDGEESGRAGGYGSNKGGKRGRNSGYKRQNPEYNEDY
ncbi:uncharacterized protein [Dendrobates tinctorius]|uniref:uncharacterized protein n=1 Tax=Dendrobates tinctorius TaxID=92724 RepID=UPI003CCA1475